MDPTTVLHKVVHGDSIENACPTKRVNRTSSCTPQPSIYVTSIEPRKLPHRSWGPVSVVDPKEPFELRVGIPGKFQIAALDRRTGTDST